MKNDITLDLLSLIIKSLDTAGETVQKSVSEIPVPPTGSWDITALDLLDLPSADTLHTAMEKLFSLGAITADSQPTRLGLLISKIRFLPIESAKMILAAYAWEVSVIDVITIAVCLEYKFSAIVDEDNLSKFQAAQANGMFTLYPQSGVIRYAQMKTELIVDDFLRYLLIFYEWQRAMAEADPSEFLTTTMQKWCEKYGIVYTTMVNIIEDREGVIENLAMLGLNPYMHLRRSIYTSINAFEDAAKLEYVRRIKQCIFEGYKNNIAVWNAGSRKYITRKTHLTLQIQRSYIQSISEIEKFGDNNPRYLMFDRIFYTNNPMNNTYEPQTDHISILDGFIPLDVNFDAIL